MQPAGVEIKNPMWRVVGEEALERCAGSVFDACDQYPDLQIEIVLAKLLERLDPSGVKEVERLADELELDDAPA